MSPDEVAAELDEQGVRALASSPHLANLVELNLDANQFNAAAMQQFVVKYLIDNWPHIRTLPGVLFVLLGVVCIGLSVPLGETTVKLSHPQKDELVERTRNLIDVDTPNTVS